MIRRAGPSDAVVLAAHRCALHDAVNPDDRADEGVHERLCAYFARALAGDGVAAWLAFEDDEPVGTVTLMIHEHPPRKTGPEVRGYITAVFVAPRARRRGHASRLMLAAIEHARAIGIRRLTLRTSEEGRPLYASLGFVPLEHLALQL